MIPFMTEAIYRNLVCSIDKTAPESVHFCDFPEVNEAWVDRDLEKDMEAVQSIVVLGRACRNTANCKQRQPLACMYVKADLTWKDGSGCEREGMSGFYTEIIADELNVKEIAFTHELDSFISYNFKPQLKTLGKRFGSRLNDLKEALANLNGAAAMAQLADTGVLKLAVGSVEEEIAKEDLLIETSRMGGYVTEENGGYAVVLDTNLTEELIEEGNVREIISKLQTMRKDAGFEVMDHICVYASGSAEIEEVMKRNEAELKRVVLAEEIVYGRTEGFAREWNLNGKDVTFAVKKL